MRQPALNQAAAPETSISASWRARAFATIAVFGTRHPRTIVTAIAVVALASLFLIPGIQVSTSRYGLVSRDNPYQARLFRFFERFGYPDAPVLVVDGGTDEARRRFVDALSDRLQREPDLRGRILARVGAGQIAELALLQRPELLSRLAERLPPDTTLTAILEGGLGEWFTAVTSRIEAGLSGGDAGGLEDPATGDAAAQERAVEQLRSLAVMVRALDDRLAGRDPGRQLQTLAGDWGRYGLDSAGYLVGSQGARHLIAMFPVLEGDEGFQVKPVVDRIRAIRDAVAETTRADGVQARLTGLPALATDELGIIQRGLLQSSAVSAIAIVVLLLLAFRSVRYTILMLVPIGVGTVITLGVVRLLYGELNLVTASFVSVLLGLGDFGCYLLSRYNEIRRAGARSAHAVREALVHAGPGALTGAVTTVLAFLTTTTTDFTAFAELGVITSIGVAVTMVCAFLLIPALVKLVALGAVEAAPEVSGLRQMAALVRNGRYPILAAAVVVTVAALFTLPRLQFNSRYFDFLPESTESAIGLRQLERDGTMSPTFASLSAEGVEETRAMAARLRVLPSVGNVHTASDLLPPLDATRLADLRASLAAFPRPPDFAALRNRGTTVADLMPRVRELADVMDEVAFALRQAGRTTAGADEVKAAVTALELQLAALPDGGRAAIGALEGEVAGILERAFGTAKHVAERGGYLPTDLPDLFKARFMSHDGKALALYVYPAGDIWNTQVAKQFAADVEGVDPNAAGLAVSIYEHERMIVEGFERAAVVALILVIVVLLIDFRSVRDAALAMVPLVSGWVWMLAAMALLGLTFNVANIVVLPLLLGIGVDAGEQIMHRCRDSESEHAGVASIDDLLRGTGGAVLLVTATTMTGFAALMMADYGAMQSFGLIMTIGMVCCLAASLLVLPALLVLIDRAR